MATTSAVGSSAISTTASSSSSSRSRSSSVQPRPRRALRRIAPSASSNGALDRDGFRPRGGALRCPWDLPGDSGRRGSCQLRLASLADVSPLPVERRPCPREAVPGDDRGCCLSRRGRRRRERSRPFESDAWWRSTLTESDGSLVVRGARRWVRRSRGKLRRRAGRACRPRRDPGRDVRRLERTGTGNVDPGRSSHARCDRGRRDAHPARASLTFSQARESTSSGKPRNRPG